MIIFSFAMITIFMTYPKIKTGNIEVHSDWSFHGLRAEQIFLNLKGSYAELNGKRTTLINSARGTIKVRTKKGINTITVGYSPSKLYYVGIIISVMTWISLLVLAFYRKGVFKINHE